MAALEEPRRRMPALIPVAVVLLATNAALGYGYLHYRGVAAEQEAAIRRVESANADLQDALGHMRDRMQRSAQQLDLANRELQGRGSVVDRGVAGRQPVSPTPPTPPTPPPTSPAAPPSGPPAAAAPLSPSAIQGALMGSSTPNNFTAPGWAPDYFSNESGPIAGPPTRPQRRSHRRESQVSSPVRETGAG